MQTAQKTRYCACGYAVERGSATCGAPECKLALLGEGKLRLEREMGGWRHYLHGEAVHCGEPLELAGFDWIDAGDLGLEQKLSEPRRWLRVRYESPLSLATEPPALLYVTVDGHTAVIAAHPGMVFRWPWKQR